MAEEPTDQASPDQQPTEGPVGDVAERGTLNSVSGVGGSARPAVDADEAMDTDAPAGNASALDNANPLAVADEPLSSAELADLREHEVAFSWRASEYVHHHKGVGWYVGLGALAVVLGGLAVWMQDWLVIVAFGAMIAAIAVYARRPPRTLTYELTGEGVTIEGKAHLYSELRSFGVLPDIEWHSIELVPKKRFMPRVSLLFEDADFDSIVGHLELHLPRIDQKPDLIDRLSRYLRF